MINIQNKVDCCGCNACGDACAQDAITFKTDNEGFWYPEVDKDKCTDCHLCEKVCPILQIDKGFNTSNYEKPKCYASVHKNLEVRFDSTSGGLFTAFAEQILKEGGLVGGAAYTEDLYVEQILISNKADLGKLRGSKYLQSNFVGFYIAVKKALDSNQKVLLCGSPCQMAAIRTFLRKEYDNLYILDYICRGIPSGFVFHKYLDYWEKREGSKVIYFKFKIKDLGWRKRTMKLGFANGKFEYDDCEHSLYDLGYHRTHAFCRPSCYNCRFIGLPRYADVTIADYWGVEKLHKTPELDKDMGTSLVICNNSKGEELFKKIQNRLVTEESSFDFCVKGNPALFSSHPKPIIDRSEFYTRLRDNSFDEVIMPLIEKAKNKESLKSRLKSFLKHFYYASRRLITVLRNGIGSTYKYFKYNSFKSIISISDSHIMPLSNVIINKHKTAKIEVTEGTLTIGYKRIAGSKLETRLLLEKDAKLKVNGNYLMFYGGDVEVFEGATLELGNNSGFNINCTIICSDKIKIGNNVAMGRNVTIRDNNGNHYISRQGYKNSRPVIIEDHAWLCEGCTIMPGVRVGTGAIVGAGSIVYANVPPFTMVSGNPAKIVDKDLCWKK